MSLADMTAVLWWWTTNSTLYDR